MKGVAYAAATAAVLAVSSVHGMETFLKQLPNGEKFAKTLGHSGTSGYTAFGTAFLNVGTTWNKEFCEQTFPGAKITNGQAFGDPCCVWTAGKAAPQSVTAFTTNPGKGTTCASNASPATAPAGGAPAPAPAGGNNKPAGGNGGGNNKPAGGNGGGNNKPAGGNGGGNGGGNNKPAGGNGGGNNKPAAGGNKKPACKKRARN